MTPFERSLSKLSENQKIIEIVSTEFKLWQLKDSSENRPDPEKHPRLPLENRRLINVSTSVSQKLLTLQIVS